MKAAKKLLSVLLSAILVAAACVPAFASSTYDRAKVAQSDETYISSLTAEETAGILLDWLDRKVASVTADFNNFEVEVFDTTVEIPLDIDSVEDILQYADYVSRLGGDFESLDVSALKGLTRANGDIEFINGIAQFAANNAEVIGKLAQWEEGKTFDLGKVGTFIEENLGADSEVKKFVDAYITGGDIGVEININDIVTSIADSLKDGGFVSEEGAEKIKTNIDLETQNAYEAVKELADLVLKDNEDALCTAYGYYLDNLVRPMFKTALGYTRSYGADAPDFKLDPDSDYSELKKLAGDTEILLRESDGTYYAFKLNENNEAVDAKEVIWTQTVKFEPVNVTISSSSGTVKTYQPMDENIAPQLYTALADRIDDENIKAMIKGDTVPEEYAALMIDANKTSELKDYVELSATQGEDKLFGFALDCSAFEEEAETTASALALEELKKALDSAGVTYGDDLAVDVDVTITYEGWATDDEFIATAAAEATPTLSGKISYSFLKDVDINTAISALKNMGVDVNQMIQDKIAEQVQNPVVTVVVDNLSGDGSALKGALELANFLDTEFVINYEILDCISTFDANNGIVGYINNFLCRFVGMLTTDEGYASLNLTEGNNGNLTANMQKICDKANEMMALAETYLSANGVALDSLLPASDEFDAGMLFDIDFSSVENLYVSGIKLALDFAAASEGSETVKEIQTEIKDLDTLEQMGAVAYNKLFDRVNSALTEKFGAKGYAYTYTDIDAAAVTEDNAKDVIMDKVADFARYGATFVFENYVPSLVNEFIDKLNTEVGTDIPAAAFTFGVEKGETWKDTLTAVVDRTYDILDGICIPTTEFTGTALAEKINNLFCSILPMGTILSNCASADGVYDCDVTIIESAIFDKAFDGDFGTFLRFFETAEKQNDFAKDGETALAVIKAFEHGADAFLPGTIVSSEYTASDLKTFFEGDNLAHITANGIVSANNRKAELIPALLELVRDFGMLPYFCRCDDDAHTFEDVAEVKATCTTEGHSAYKVCTVCGKEDGKTVYAIDAAAHTNVVDVAAVESTCTKAGSTAGTKCADCGAVITGCEPTALKAHTAVKVAGKAATCTESGLTDGSKCSVCETVLEKQTEIPAAGHDYGEDGTCKNCGEKKPEQSKSFFQKIADFFRKIINWFKNLFKR